MWDDRKKQVEVNELISREYVARPKGNITILAHPAEDGGVDIGYNGRMVASGLNTMEAFVTLAGMLKNCPHNVRIVMPTVSENFTHHFLTGYRATKA